MRAGRFNGASAISANLLAALLLVPSLGFGASAGDSGTAADALTGLIQSWRAAGAVASGAKLEARLRETWRLTEVQPGGVVFDQPITAAAVFSLVTRLPVTGAAEAPPNDLAQARKDLDEACAAASGQLVRTDLDALPSSSVPVVAKAIGALVKREALGQFDCRQGGQTPLFRAVVKPAGGAVSTVLPPGWDWHISIVLFAGEDLARLQSSAAIYAQSVERFRAAVKAGDGVQVPSTELPPAAMSPAAQRLRDRVAFTCAMVTDVKPPLLTVQVGTSSLALPIEKSFPQGKALDVAEAGRASMDRQSYCMKAF